MALYENRAKLRVGCFIPLKDPTSQSKKGEMRFEPGREVSKDECTNISKDLKLTEVYVTLIELWFSLIDEINTLKPIVRGEKYEIGYNLDELKRKYARKQERKVERKFMNMLTIFKSFLEQIETFLKRYCQNIDNAFKKWEAIKNKAYGNDFSYRFIYKLRNYVQHVGMAPIKWVNAGQKDEPYTIKMFFSKNELILHKDCLGVVVNDLRSMPDFIDASIIINDFENCLLRVLKEFVDIVDKEVKEAALRVLSYRSNLSKTAYLAVWWYSDNPGSNGFTVKEYMHINDGSATLVTSGFPYDHNQVLNPDLFDSVERAVSQYGRRF